MHEDRREKLHRAVEEAARAEVDHDKQQRNAGVAIGLLFLLVLALLVAVVTGGTDALRPGGVRPRRTGGRPRLRAPGRCSPAR